MARIYALTLITILIILCIAYVVVRPSFASNFIIMPYDKPQPTRIINATWTEFLQDCGGAVIVENYVHARSEFNRKYENQIVLWTGLYAGQKDPKAVTGTGGRFQHLLGSDHVNNVFIKMEPTESVMYPDLMLSVSTHVLNNHREFF
jgi:hypothetical protein